MVYITRYALDKGVLEAEILTKAVVTDSYTKEKETCYELVAPVGKAHYFIPVSEVEETLEAAMQKAEEMRKEEIVRLKERIKELETMTIEVQRFPDPSCKE